DAEHRQMVSLISRICERVAAGEDATAASLLSDLQFVAETHFHNEDALLARIDEEIALDRLQSVVRAAILEHAREHRQKLDELHRLTERWRRGVAAAARMRFCDELKTWFVDHAVVYEAQIKTILQSTHNRSEPGGFVIRRRPS